MTTLSVLVGGVGAFALGAGSMIYHHIHSTDCDARELFVKENVMPVLNELGYEARPRDVYRLSDDLFSAGLAPDRR